jgi:hypothetical protein
MILLWAESSTGAAVLYPEKFLEWAENLRISSINTMQIIKKYQHDFSSVVIDKSYMLKPISLLSQFAYIQP